MSARTIAFDSAVCTRKDVGNEGVRNSTIVDYPRKKEMRKGLERERKALTKVEESGVRERATKTPLRRLATVGLSTTARRFVENPRTFTSDRVTISSGVERRPLGTSRSSTSSRLRSLERGRPRIRKRENGKRRTSVPEP